MVGERIIRTKTSSQADTNVDQANEVLEKKNRVLFS